MAKLINSVRLKLLGINFCTIIHEDNTKKKKKLCLQKGLQAIILWYFLYPFFSLYLYDNDSQQCNQPIHLNSYFNLHVSLSLWHPVSVTLSNFKFVSQNVTNKSCLVCFMSGKNALLVT